MDPDRLLFNGSSKSAADLALAVEKGVRVSVDSLDELHSLDRIAGEAGETAEIAFRVNPALEVPTHPKIATGLGPRSSASLPAISLPHTGPPSGAIMSDPGVSTAISARRSSRWSPLHGRLR